MTIAPATSEKIDTEVTAFLPKKSRGYITSKFKTDEINKLFYGELFYGWKYLNKSFEDNIEIEKGHPIVFFCRWARKLKISPSNKQDKDKKGEEKLHVEKQKGRKEAF